jgi:LPXTG-motif cell wall-anchored protein
VVTTVTTIEGTVWKVNPPVSVIVAQPGGNKQYKIPKDQKFVVNGKEVDAFHLKEGMKITATVITDVPEQEFAAQQKVTGETPPPQIATAPMQGPLLLSEPAPPALAPAPTVAKAAPSERLPQTGSALPLMGLLGVLLSGIGIARLRARHKEAGGKAIGA